MLGLSLHVTRSLFMQASFKRIIESTEFVKSAVMPSLNDRTKENWHRSES